MICRLKFIKKNISSFMYFFAIKVLVAEDPLEVHIQVR